jgi:hypothetical protein
MLGTANLAPVQSLLSDFRLFHDELFRLPPSYSGNEIADIVYQRGPFEQFRWVCKTLSEFGHQYANYSASVISDFNELLESFNCNTRSHFGLSKQLAERILYQSLPSRQWQIKDGIWYN